LSLINSCFEDFFDKKLDRTIDDNITRLRFLTYILIFYGVKLNYNFTWWKYGPYSLELTYDRDRVERRRKTQLTKGELKIVEKIKNGKDILKNSKKALLVASYLYLKRLMNDVSSEEGVIKELTTRKPYLCTAEIHQVISEWKKAIK
jgi:uncharacterized protein YwgA